MALERNINQILTNKLFKNCTERIFSYSLSNKNFTDFKEGDIIFQAGDSSNFIYLVISGEVKIKFKNINKVILKSTDDFFGDIEITKETSRNSSAVAISDCVLYRIDKGTFNKLCNVENQIITNISNIEKEELRDISEARPRPDIPSVLKLDSSPIKLDIFKRKKRDEQRIEGEIDSQIKKFPPESKENIKKVKSDIPEIPDLDSVIEEIKSNKPESESLKKELLSDTEDFANWNFTTIENPDEEAKKVKEFSEISPQIDEKEIEKRLLERHNHELNELRTLLTKKFDFYLQSIAKLLPGLNSSETCEKIVNVFIQHFNANFASLFLVDDKTSNLELVYPESSKPLTAIFNEGLSGRAAANKKILVVRNPAKDIRFESSFDIPKGFTEGSVAYVPLNDSENKLVGVIQLARTMKDFSKEDEDALKVLAEQAGIVMRHSLINEELFKQEKISAFGAISKFLMQDIKSPILTIKHYSNLISRIDIPEQIKKVLTMLSMQANSVVDIMQATFDFSEDRSSVKLQKVQFNENLANILELLSEYTESRNVKLFRKYGDDVQVDIDPRRFYVVCFQVIKNACEAMPSGGKIFVNTELLNGSVTLNIRDEGFGIRDEIKNNIFNAFFSSGKENATGLGLAIAKYLITLMNGSISFQSKINEGTKMIIRLPIAEE